MIRKSIMTALCAATLAGVAQSQAGIITVSTDITANNTMVNIHEYHLTRPIFVRNGATLTIEPGTIIRGRPDTGNGPGTLVVSRDGRIRMMGTESQPIVMTDTNDMHYVGPTPTATTGVYATKHNDICKKWGGLILLGSTYIADNTSTNQIEGLQALGDKSIYGGSDDDCDSGEIHYVSIRYGGFNLSAANEINGLTMGAVGRGTEIDHVEVFQNKDDAFEWFGGTVNTKYLMAWGQGDDAFDWDQGFRGKGQFWFSVKGTIFDVAREYSDNSCEMDGATDGDAIQPSSCPTIYNATFVGLGETTTDDRMWYFSDGSAGRFYNTMGLDFGGKIITVENTGVYPSLAHTTRLYKQNASFTHDANLSYMLEARNCMFWNYGDPNSDTNYSLWQDWQNNAYSDLIAEEAPIVNLQRTTVGALEPVTFIDPRIKDRRYINANAQPPAVDQFFTPVAFQGAFHKYNWAAWTCAAKQGFMPTTDAGNYEGKAQLSITKVGNLVSFNMVADTHAGFIGDVYMVYKVGGNLFSYDRATGTWVPGLKPIAMPMRDFSLTDVLDVTGLPAGTAIYFIADQLADGVLTFPQFGYQTLVL